MYPLRSAQLDTDFFALSHVSLILDWIYFLNIDQYQLEKREERGCTVKRLFQQSPLQVFSSHSNWTSKAEEPGTAIIISGHFQFRGLASELESVHDIPHN